MAIGAKVQASKLSPVVNEDMIRKLFEFIGPLDNLVLIPSPLGSGFEAIIEYRDKGAAFTATHLTGTLFGGRPLTVTQMEVTLPASALGTTPTVRPFTNLTMQQQHAQQQLQASAPGSATGQGSNPMIRMGATTQFSNGMPGMPGMPMGIPPMFPSPHMTLYNPNGSNMMAQQFQHQHPARAAAMMMDQQQQPQQPQLDLDKVDTKTVYIGNLPLTVTNEQLEEIFQDCGVITRVNIAGKPTHPTRFAFMDFDTVEGAKKALMSTEKMIGDRRLRVNLPRHSGPMPFMMHQNPSTSGHMMQHPHHHHLLQFQQQIQPQQPSAVDATRTRYKNILIGLINRGGDPSLHKILEDLQAGGPLPDLSDVPGVPSDIAMMSAEGSPSRGSATGGAAAVGTDGTAASGAAGSTPAVNATTLLEKLVSASRRRSRSRSSSITRRRSRSRSMDRRGDRDRDYYRRSSKRRSPSGSRSGYSRSSRGEYEADYGRYDYREREREREREPSRSERERSSRGGYGESSRDRERERDRDREREKPRERERERDRSDRGDKDRERHRESSDRHRSHRGRDSDRAPRTSTIEKAGSDMDVRMKSPSADRANAEK